MTRIAFALLLALASVSAAGTPLSIRATAEPAVTLPGLPVRIVLIVENTADVTVQLPRRMVLEARSESGDTFIPGVLGFPIQVFPPEYDELLTLKPREKRVYEIPMSETLTSGAMADPRLWKPGAYTLQLFLHDELRDYDLDQYGLEGLLRAGRIGTPLVTSSEATLRIEEPIGIDAEVWKTIVEKTDGRGFMRTEECKADAIANELWARGAESVYWPYLIHGMFCTPREHLKPRWKAIVERDPNHPVAEMIRLGRAHAKALDAENSIDDGVDLETILKLTEEARAELTILQKTARQHLVRVRAAEKLAHVKSAERLTAMYRDLAPKR